MREFEEQTRKKHDKLDDVVEGMLGSSIGQNMSDAEREQRREEKVAEGPYENLWVGQCLLQRWADISGKDRVEQAEDGVLARGIAFHGRRRDPLCSRQHGAH